jgi:hypothetical protein
MTDALQPDVRVQVDQLEKQFTAVDNRVIGLSRDVTGIMTAVDKIGSQVGELTRVVTTMQAASAVAPRFDGMKIGGMIASIVVIVGAVTAGITYVAKASMWGDILEVKIRAEMHADFLRERLDNGWFKPGLQIRAPGGTVTQQ